MEIVARTRRSYKEPKKISEFPPPHNEEAEMGLLGSMLLNPDALRLGLDLRPDDFYRTSHRKIFVGMKALSAGSNPVDLIALTDWLQQAGELDEAGGAAYVTSLLDTPVPINAAHYAKIVLRDAHKRRLLEEGHRLVESASNGQLPAEVTAKMIERLQGAQLEFDPSLEKGAWSNRITSQNLLTAQVEEVSWLPFLGRSGIVGPSLVTLFSAHGKTGKTTVLFSAVRDLLQQRPELRVAWLTEEAQPVWKSRLVRSRFTSPNLTLWFLDGKPWTQRLQELEREQIDLLIVDTIRAHCGITDENDTAECTRVLQPLILQTQRRNRACLLVHHLRKAAADPGLGHAGSHALFGMADVGLEMHRDQHTQRRRRLRTVSRFIDDEWVVEQDPDGNLRVLGDPEALALEELSERVLVVLSDEGKPAKEIHDEIGEPRPSKAQLQNALNGLERNQKARHDGSGKRGSPFLWMRLKELN